MQEFVGIVQPAEHRWNVNRDHERIAQVVLQDHEVVPFAEMIRDLENHEARISLGNAQNDEGTLVRFVPADWVLPVV